MPSTRLHITLYWIKQNGNFNEIQNGHYFVRGFINIAVLLSYDVLVQIAYQCWIMLPFFTYTVFI